VLKEGFIKGSRTEDNIFVLKIYVDKHSKTKKMWVILAWFTVKEAGTRENMINSIK
jgi:hypothetical protein